LGLVQLDQVFGLAALAVDGLVEMRGRVGQRGDDAADVEAERSRRQAGDDAALPAPAFISTLVVNLQSER
jgi:hypothetical protein